MYSISMNEKMTLGQTMPIGALCILCHDADEVLPFYRDILGFEPRRAEESFYHFAKRGAATSLCLWEIDHIARHTVFQSHPKTAIPNKFILSLSLPSTSAVEALHGKLANENVRLLQEPEVGEDGFGFHFIDPCAVIWEVRVPETVVQANNTLALDRITLLCRDLTATKSFYEDKLSFPDVAVAAGRVTYPAVAGTALSLWQVTAASAGLCLADLPAQQAQWSAKTAMLAYPFDEIAEVEALYDDLRRAGVRFDEAPSHFDWDFKAAYFCDPEDNIWELFETPSNIEQRMLPKVG